MPFDEVRVKYQAPFADEPRPGSRTGVRSACIVALVRDPRGSTLDPGVRAAGPGAMTPTPGARTARTSRSAPEARTRGLVRASGVFSAGASARTELSAAVSRVSDRNRAAWTATVRPWRRDGFRRPRPEGRRVVDVDGQHRLPRHVACPDHRCRGCDGQNQPDQGGEARTLLSPRTAAFVARAGHVPLPSSLSRCGGVYSGVSRLKRGRSQTTNRGSGRMPARV